jgi:hypothetical protein
MTTLTVDVPFGFGDHDLRDCPPLVFAHDYEVGMAVLWTPCNEYRRTAVVVEDIMPIYGDSRICIAIDAPDGVYVRRVARKQLTPVIDESIEADHEWIRGGC